MQRHVPQPNPRVRVEITLFLQYSSALSCGPAQGSLMMTVLTPGLDKLAFIGEVRQCY